MRMPTTVRPSDITGMISTTRSVSGVLMFESVSLTGEPVGVAPMASTASWTELTPAPLTARILSPLASPAFSAGESFTVPATTGSLSQGTRPRWMTGGRPLMSSRLTPASEKCLTKVSSPRENLTGMSALPARPKSSTFMSVMPRTGAPLTDSTRSPCLTCSLAACVPAGGVPMTAAKSGVPIAPTIT